MDHRAGVESSTAAAARGGAQWQQPSGREGPLGKEGERTVALI